LRKRIVTIGGGTGHYSLLRGLKKYDVDLAAVVSVADNGGSTGELRTDFGILAPGDLRNCLVALSDESEIADIARLFEYRFSEKSRRLGNHSVGNIILAALSDLTGDMATALKVASKILRTRGRVLPVSLDASTLFARTAGGRVLEGEQQVSYPPRHERVVEVWHQPAANVFRDSADAVRDCDLAVVCPGDLYGSLVPNFVIRGMREAVAECRGRLVYVCNLVTKRGTLSYKASDFVREIERFAGRRLDVVLYNTRRPTRTVMDKYRAEESAFVEPDVARLRAMGVKAVGGELMQEYESGGKTVVRHDSERTARMIVELV
jgi:uncharacterized cofD-like protein